jgi:5-methylcytosine-specific restriction enzyme subunit McrC
MEEKLVKYEKIEHEFCEELRSLELKFGGNNPYLGLDSNEYRLSYFIGLNWLEENKSYLVVNPKIKDLDYVRMFVHCLGHQETSHFLKGIYHIDFEKPHIRISTEVFDLTPFLLVHFLAVIEKIVKQGLKSNYIIKEENLNSKIKGKIIFLQQIKKNIVTKRSDRMFCRFQEYSADCLENRLLKKALLFVQRYINKNLNEEKYKILSQKVNRSISAFENVSDEISISEIKRIKINSLYREYTEAIDLAKQILRYFGYSYKKADEAKTLAEKELPQFYIDMSKLFELYVYSLLKDNYGKEILYQSYGKYGYVDFLKKDEKLIIDTKYKKIYDKVEEYKIEDIRQLSGYARDEGVLEKLEIFNNDTVVDCVIIYPAQEKEVDFKDRKLKEERIKGFTKFHKCGIKLPLCKIK